MATDATFATAYSVADAGFLEGGFCYGIAREFLKPHPLSVKTTYIFDSFGE